MKHLMAMVLLTFSVPVTSVRLAGSQNRDAVPSARDQFVGAWRLVSLEEEGADGTLHKADCTGNLVFTQDGHMAVQVMYRNPQAANSPYTVEGYEATFGRYDVNERAHTFTFHVDGAIVRSLIGKDLPRKYEFSAKRLIVSSTDPKEHWRVTWEHD